MILYLVQIFSFCMHESLDEWWFCAFCHLRYIFEGKENKKEVDSKTKSKDKGEKASQPKVVARLQVNIKICPSISHERILFLWCLWWFFYLFFMRRLQYSFTCYYLVSFITTRVFFAFLIFLVLAINNNSFIIKKEYNRLDLRKFINVEWVLWETVWKPKEFIVAYSCFTLILTLFSIDVVLLDLKLFSP